MLNFYAGRLCYIVGRRNPIQVGYRSTARHGKTRKRR